MEPFKVSNHLKDIISQYPEAQLIHDVAKQGGEPVRQAIARLWLSEGIPFAFKNCPGVYESIRSWVGLRLNIDPKEFNVTGSARLGQSLAPSKIGKPFGDGSDLDIFIISSELFEHLRKDFNAWSFDFESGAISASNKTENGYWINNLERGPRNIARGFIDSNIIPNYDKYQYAKNISQTMFLLNKKLDITLGAPKFSYASVRCYKSWSSYVQQISLGFQ